MSYELVLNNTKKIEKSLLNMGAEGKGLHEKLSSIETKIDSNIRKKIRFIATVRNQLVHDDDYKLTNEIKKDFLNACEIVLSSLKRNDVSKISFNQRYNIQKNSIHENKTQSTSSNDSTCDNYKKRLEQMKEKQKNPSLQNNQDMTKSSKLNPYISWLLFFIGFFTLIIITEVIKSN